MDLKRAIFRDRKRLFSGEGQKNLWADQMKLIGKRYTANVIASLESLKSEIDSEVRLEISIDCVDSRLIWSK